LKQGNPLKVFLVHDGQVSEQGNARQANSHGLERVVALTWYAPAEVEAAVSASDVSWIDLQRSDLWFTLHHADMRRGIIGYQTPNPNPNPNPNPVFQMSSSHRMV
jgi:hypothetical protein